MKTTIALILACAFFYLLNVLKPTEKVGSLLPRKLGNVLINTSNNPLRICFLQDASKSIRSNGVELISSDVFAPFFNDIDRTIEINFGIISSASTREMITVSLPATTLRHPQSPDSRIMSITEKHSIKQAYVSALRDYERDSTTYFKDRTGRIRIFRGKVDSLVSLYRNHLTSWTDISSALAVTDRVFNSSITDSSENVLIVNSDGQSNAGGTVHALKNRAEIILVNAGPDRKTSLDGMVNIRFQSPEQSINYLTHKK